MILSTDSIFFPIIIFAASLFLCLMMEVRLRFLLIRFSEPMFIALVLLLLKFFFSGNSVLFSIHFAGITITGYHDGLMEGLQISCRILGAVSLIAVISFVTPFTEIISGLSWFKIPKQFIELLILTYRYIFILFDDAVVIYNAQKNRLGYSGFRRGLNSLGVLSGELVLRAFDRSQKTAVAMTQRGYTGDIPFTTSDSLRTKDIIIAILSMAALGVIWKIL